MLVADPDAAKEKQARYFDEHQDAEFEVSRPHGTPELYRWYYEEKFERSIRGIGHLLLGATALTVCGGSGMDAEFLARRGASVISSDISPGACRRAAERAHRFGVSITPLVADAERLPFPDRSVDVVYVHDGLHHLERPEGALAEMARVAARVVSLTEPADAAVTALAVRARLALEVEDAGNRVERLELDDLCAALRMHGFRIVEAHRYAMYHRHEPGRVIGVLSRPGLRQLVKAAVSGFNAVAGQIGNRLTVQAVRV
jgi:SAM-dependent methyltransferase